MIRRIIWHTAVILHGVCLLLMLFAETWTQVLAGFGGMVLASSTLVIYKYEINKGRNNEST